MKIKLLRTTILTALIFITTTSFQVKHPIKGVWTYQGGIYNGKAIGVPKDTKIQRVYTLTGYDAFITKADGKSTKYESGTYSLKKNNYIETQTFSADPSPLKGKTITYTWSVNNDILTIKGKLPDNSPVEEHWKKFVSF